VGRSTWRWWEAGEVLIALTSGKGSPGATWCLANLGVALARTRPVLALDADPAGGALAAHLGYSPRAGLYPLSRHGLRPTAEQLAAEVEQRHGLAAIAGMPRAFGAEVLDLPALLASARSLAPTVLVDVGRLPGPGLAAIVGCEAALVVVRPGPSGVLAAEQALLAIAGAAPNLPLQLVVSGLRRRPHLADVQAILGPSVLGVIPWVPAEAARAGDEQRPVQGKAHKAFAQLAQALAAPGLTGESARALSTRRLIRRTSEAMGAVEGGS
jgi:MinD-like ATPase involved in chromosome partitioning or flagellar assembly